MLGSRRASIVLPEPGGPIISTLWPPAAAIEQRALRELVAGDVGEVGARLGRDERVGPAARATRRQSACAAGSGARAAGSRRPPELAAIRSVGGSEQRQPERSRAPARRRASREPAAPSRRATARPPPRTARRARAGAARSPSSSPSAIGRSNPVPCLRSGPGREIHHDSGVGQLEPRRSHRRADALPRLLHREIGQPDDRERRQSRADVDLGRRPVSPRRPASVAVRTVHWATSLTPARTRRDGAAAARGPRR